MKPFPFETIREYKEQLRDKTEREYSALLKKERDILDQIEKLKMDKVEISNKIMKVYEKRFDLKLIQFYNSHIDYVQTEINNCLKQIQKLKQEIAQKKEQLKLDSIELNKFEELKKSYIKKEMEKIVYNEKKELDEIVSIRGNRKGDIL